MENTSQIVRDSRVKYESFVSLVLSGIPYGSMKRGLGRVAQDLTRRVNQWAASMREALRAAQRPPKTFERVPGGMSADADAVRQADEDEAWLRENHRICAKATNGKLFPPHVPLGVISVQRPK